MSLDVYLTLKGVQGEERQAIFVREDGQNKEVSREEFERRFPGREPVVVTIPSDDESAYSANITHNLGSMADAAGIYYFLWRPEEVGVTRASQLIEPLGVGLRKLLDEPEKYKAHNPPNGWGSYDGLVRFVSSYLEACETYPDAEVYASR